MEKYTILRDTSTIAQNSMRLREERSGKIIAEMRVEPLNLRIIVFFVATFILFTEYFRERFGDNFIPSRIFVAVGIVITIAYQFTSRGWDLFLHDPIVNRVAHNGKIRRRGGSGYQIMDRGKKARHTLVLKGSSDSSESDEVETTETTSFKLVQEQPKGEIFRLESTTDDDYTSIRCNNTDTEVFSAKYHNFVRIDSDSGKIIGGETKLEMTNPTHRLLGFTVITLMIFKFQKFI